MSVFAEALSFLKFSYMIITILVRVPGGSCSPIKLANADLMEVLGTCLKFMKSIVGHSKFLANDYFTDRTKY